MSKAMKVGLLAVVGLILLVVVYYSFIADGRPHPAPADSSASQTTAPADDTAGSTVSSDPSLTASTSSSATGRQDQAPASGQSLTDWLQQTRQPAIVSGSETSSPPSPSTTGGSDDTATTTGPSWLTTPTPQTGSSPTGSTASTPSPTGSTASTAGSGPTGDTTATTTGPDTTGSTAATGTVPSAGTSPTSDSATTTSSSGSGESALPSWLSGGGQASGQASDNPTAPRPRPDIYDPFGSQSPPLRVTGSAGPPSASSSGQRTYTVKPGDTLGQIAAQVYGKSSLWREIAQANPGVDPNALQVGQVLTLPPLPPSVTGQVPASPGQLPTEPSGKVYLVQAGDTLSSIAEKLYGSARHVSLILQANPDLEPTSLKIGQQLVIPDLPAPSTQAPAAPGDLLERDPTLPGRMIYVVQPGDTLGSIARRQYGKAALWRRIAQANPQVDPAALQIGQRLVIPEPPEPTSPAGANASASVVEDPLDIGIDPAARHYTVRPGDSLWSIAEQEYGDGTLWNLIYQANTTRMRNKDDLRVGQTLVIPPKPQPSTPPPATP